MNISVERVNRLLASGRGYAQAGAGFVLATGIFSISQDKTLTDSIAEVFNGLGMVVHGVSSIWQIGVVVLTPVVSFFLARWSSKSASVPSQAASVKQAVADPNTLIAPEVKDIIVSTAKAV